uniref:Uncharacterized protein n=1 Tax=Plectus sambesii TaxID=2011161 RepID=A0A914WSU2_9BILA
MFQWIRTHVALFLERYASIGECHDSAQQISREHEDFATAAMNTYVNVNHIMTVAKRLLETGNYGRQQIQNVATRLEQDWQLFSKALDTRGAVLNLSVNFHYKANLYLSNVEEWTRRCAAANEPQPSQTRDVGELEAQIHQHQLLMDSVTQAYSEVREIDRRTTHSCGLC